MTFNGNLDLYNTSYGMGLSDHAPNLEVNVVNKKNLRPSMTIPKPGPGAEDHRCLYRFSC